MELNYNINSDVGEGMGDDTALMPLIQACNIACGGHAGSKTEIQKTVELATKNNILIGAHPSYPDRKNFGRHSLNLSKESLSQSIEEQLTILLDQLHLYKLHHVKLHGALYHDCNSNKEIAKTVLNVIKSKCPNAVIFTPPKSVLALQALKMGFIVWAEAFVDRAYQDNGQLVPRTENDAVLREPKQLFKRFENLIQKKGVFSINNNWLSLNAKTFCVHGDHPNAAKYLRAVLEHYKKIHSKP
ncbi:5-oxoprolinase subunit PxpA [Flavobacteriaceae bacterium]|nr:5-oxoprolinase subunit PxpA [Flavobacteriaceae bacterium]MDB3861964.1 5-oxoprolinase subunit PxpA [Flavobacteriaceae bacterium]